MGRSVVFAGALLALALAGCSSLNPFGGPSKPAVAPADKPQGATAEPAKPKREPDSAKLARFDANDDGLVAGAELEQGLTADFKREDTNGDEALDVAETRVLNDRIRKEQSSSPVFDWNADGRIVYTEFASQWRTLFQRSDVDGDGVVDEVELKARRRENKPRDLPKPTFSGQDGRPPGSP
jgi:Ca2+-binding EF-hand superfamily protein